MPRVIAEHVEAATECVTLHLHLVLCADDGHRVLGFHEQPCELRVGATLSERREPRVPAVDVGYEPGPELLVAFLREEEDALAVEERILRRNGIEE